jgi:hypothetical protein
MAYEMPLGGGHPPHQFKVPRQAPLKLFQLGIRSFHLLDTVGAWIS